jgi:hypothetical protein
MTAVGFDISFGFPGITLNQTYGKFYMNWVEFARTAGDLMPTK